MGSSSAERMRAMRARRAASIETAPASGPRDPDELLLPSVRETLTHLDLGPEHAAAAQLAQRYAKVIDEAKDPAWGCRWIGPLLLAALAELGATPAAREQLAKGAKTAPQGPNRLDQLRASRGAPDRGRGRL
jgi:hypothetical protein